MAVSRGETDGKPRSKISATQFTRTGTFVTAIFLLELISLVPTNSHCVPEDENFQPSPRQSILPSNLIPLSFSDSTADKIILIFHES